MRKPRLSDFYDELDPRGCSGSEYADYEKALAEYHRLSILENSLDKQLESETKKTLTEWLHEKRMKSGKTRN